MDIYPSMSDLFALCAALLSTPTPELAAALCDGSVRADTTVLLRECGCAERTVEGVASLLAAPKLDGDVDGFFHGLRTEYTRLFTAPEHRAMQIYEQAFLHSLKESGLTGTFMGSLSARDAKRLYAEAGYEVRAAESQDHMAIQLEFCSRLLPQADLVRLYEFKRLHLDKWCPTFFPRLEGASNHRVYVAVGRCGAFAYRRLGQTLENLRDPVEPARFGEGQV